MQFMLNRTYKTRSVLSDIASLLLLVIVLNYLQAGLHEFVVCDVIKWYRGINAYNILGNILVTLTQHKIWRLITCTKITTYKAYGLVQTGVSYERSFKIPHF